VVSRRASQKPPQDGGWNMLFTNFVIADVVNPVVNILLNAKGRHGAWFGWPEDTRMEALRNAFVRSSSREEQKKIASDIQREAYDQVFYVPLGQWRALAAWRKSLSGVLEGPATPVFWNIDKSE